MQRPLTLTLATAIVLLSADLSAQADSSVAAATSAAQRVMHRVRVEGVSGEALFVLRNFRGQWTQQQQDEVADSLTAFVINWTEADQFKSLQAASLALSLSGRTEGYGTPYRGAGDRMRRIAESGMPGQSGGAVNAIYHLADSSEAFAILEGLARFDGRVAELAVQWLEARLGERGLDATPQRDSGRTPQSVPLANPPYPLDILSYARPVGGVDARLFDAFRRRRVLRSLLLTG